MVLAQEQMDGVFGDAPHRRNKCKCFNVRYIQNVQNCCDKMCLWSSITFIPFAFALKTLKKWMKYSSFMTHLRLIHFLQFWWTTLKKLNWLLFPDPWSKLRSKRPCHFFIYSIKLPQTRDAWFALSGESKCIGSQWPVLAVIFCLFSAM